ncbi:hypothetical protein ABK040_012108 [Willaertia magna]
MPVRTIRDLPSDNNNNQPNRQSAPVPPTWTSGGGRSLASGEQVSYTPTDANYQNTSSINDNGGNSGGSWGNRFSNIFSFGRSNNDVEQGNTTTGSNIQGMTNDPMQAQFEMNEDMFWSYNLHGVQPQWYHMCLMCCCPCFVGNPCSPVRKGDYIRMLKTFLFWISIIQIIYFIVELSVGGIDSKNTSLGPPASTLLLLGAKSAAYIKHKYQIFRLITPIFMHAGFMHIFMNLFIQIMVCMSYEGNNKFPWKWYRVIPIYFIAGIGGNLLSCVAIPQSISVGASGAIMGLIGAKVSSIIIRWRSIPTQLKVSQCISVGIIIVITLLWSFSDYIDWAGHIGGLLIGFIFGFSMFATEIKDKVYKYTIIGISSGLTFIYFLTLSLVFGLVTQV